MSYEDRINLAKARLQTKSHLDKGQSKAILINDCPYCNQYAACSRIIMDDGRHVEQICKIRSNELESVWLNIREDDRPVVKMGDKYGKLIVIIPQKPDEHGNKRWLCKCECGKGKIVRSDNLLTGKTSSCGCDQGKHDIVAACSGRRTIRYEDVKEQRIASEVLTADLIKHREASEYVSKEDQDTDHQRSYQDQDYYYHEAFLKGYCPECESKIKHDEHGDKVCRNEQCGLMDNYNINWEGIPGYDPDAIRRIGNRYDRLEPQESYGQPPTDDLRKLILLKEIAMSDNIDRTYGEWGSVQSVIFHPNGQLESPQIGYTELCDPINKHPPKIGFTIQHKKHPDADRDYVAEFKAWCNSF
jgi:hypothetical protein